MDQGETLETTDGHVKWFDPGKGFGFVVADDGGADILLHANVLRNFGQSSVADGARVRIRVQQTQRGIQAVEVLSIEAPTPQMQGDEGAENGRKCDFFDPGLVGGPPQPARIKWFDKVKGFGFANVFGSSEDIFVHIEVLRRGGLADLQAGEAIAIRVADGARGKLATEIGIWDTAAQTDQSPS
ncbi:cold-shock protein [Oceaniglobus indicus]|uniref:cold-shock protein n=1 Tax=Oceaniglobus indicus TaxID=2047749 RepID=UPI001475662E|nr:cold shock domain-containing protein [Oceaniglobus indicus]